MSEKKLKELKDPLDEEALYDLFYNILWTKETMYEEADFKLYVPDTVIYRSGTPVSWYFSTSDGVLKKKKSGNLSNEIVLETFLRKKPKSNIIGYFISISSKPEQDEGQPKTPVMEYFDEKSFRELMKNPQRLHRGILQRFIDPPGPHNNVIQTVWTSNVCILGRRVNVKNLYDQYSNPFERCVTYDGPDYLSIATPVRGIFSTKIKELLEKIVRHVAGASFDKYSLLKFVSYLKTDETGKVWYLWSGYVKFATRVSQKSKAANATTTFGTSVDLSYLESHFEVSKEKCLPQLGKPSLEKPQTCVNCEQNYCNKDFVEIDYKKIIQDAPNNPNMNTARENIEDDKDQLKLLICPKDSKKYRDLAETLRVRDKNADIPLLIRKLHPTLRPKEFVKLKNEQYFLNKKVDVCYNCFFEIVTTNNLAGNEELFINDQVVLKGTQGLRHESLKIKKEVLDAHIKGKKIENVSTAKIRAASVDPALKRSNTTAGISMLKLEQLYAKDTREGAHSSMSKRDSTRAATSLSRVTRNQSNPSLSRGATPFRLEQNTEYKDGEFEAPSGIANSRVDKDPNELMKWLQKEDNIFLRAKSKQILTQDNFALPPRHIDEGKIKLKEFSKNFDKVGMIDVNRLYSLLQKRNLSREEDKTESFPNSGTFHMSGTEARQKSESRLFKKTEDFADTYYRLKNMNFTTHDRILVGNPSVEINSKIYRNISPDEERLFNDQIMNLETPEKTLNENPEDSKNENEEKVQQNEDDDDDVEEIASPAISNGIGSIPEDVPISSNYGSQKEIESNQNSKKNSPRAMNKGGSQRDIDNALKFSNIFSIYKPSTGTSYREPYHK